MRVAVPQDRRQIGLHPLHLRPALRQGRRLALLRVTGLRRGTVFGLHVDDVADHLAAAIGARRGQPHLHAHPVQAAIRAAELPIVPRAARTQHLADHVVDQPGARPVQVVEAVVPGEVLGRPAGHRLDVAAPVEQAGRTVRVGVAVQDDGRQSGIQPRHLRPPLRQRRRLALARRLRRLGGGVFGGDVDHVADHLAAAIRPLLHPAGAAAHPAQAAVRRADAPIDQGDALPQHTLLEGREEGRAALGQREQPAIRGQLRRGPAAHRLGVAAAIDQPGRAVG